MVQTVQEFIQTDIHAPIVDKSLLALVAINALGSILSLVLNNLRIAVIITAATSGLTVAYSYPALLYMAYIIKIRQAKFLVTALSLLAIGVTMYLFKTIGVLPDTFITAYGMQIGFVAMIVLLSFGLADRINVLKAKIEKAENPEIILYARNHLDS